MAKSIIKPLIGSRIMLKQIFRNLSYGQHKAQHVCVSVDKNPTLADESVILKITGLEAFQRVTLHASTRLLNQTLFDSISHMVADKSGRVSFDHDPSHGGNYEGVDCMGPISRLVSSELNERKYDRFMIKEPMSSFHIELRVLDSFYDSSKTIAEQGLAMKPPNLILERTYAGPGVQEINIREGRVRGTLYLPAGDGPFPGVISMSGGYPGAMKFKAALLASRGFAAIALKYFGEDDLTKEFMNVDIAYIEEACNLLRSHRKVEGKNGVGIIANCFGGLIGLGTASIVPDGLIRCVTSINGWPLIFGKFKYGDKRWSTSKNFKKTVTVDSSGVTHWSHDYNIDHKIETSDFIESDCFPFHRRHKTSYLFVASGDDTYVPCEQVMKPVQQKLEKAQHPDYQFLYYPKAGHLIEHSFHPHADIAWTMGEAHMVGGMQPYHSKAQEDSWPKILDFTYERLMGKQRPKFST